MDHDTYSTALHMSTETPWQCHHACLPKGHRCLEANVTLTRCHLPLFLKKLFSSLPSDPESPSYILTSRCTRALITCSCQRAPISDTNSALHTSQRATCLFALQSPISKTNQAPLQCMPPAHATCPIIALHKRLWHAPNRCHGSSISRAGRTNLQGDPSRGCTFDNFIVQQKTSVLLHATCTDSAEHQHVSISSILTSNSVYTVL